MTAYGKAKPFVKWMGGKRRIFNYLEKFIPYQMDTYHEPFLGGGFVLFNIRDRAKKVHVSDLNKDLINCYIAIRDNCDELVERLKWYKTMNSKGAFLTLRDTHADKTGVESAASFIYINRTCYNGLITVNKQGKLTSGYGNYADPPILNEPNLRLVSKFLQSENIKIELADFTRVEPKQGDFVYCDPPYDGTCTDYTEYNFYDADQRRLAEHAAKWSKTGALVVLSNSDTEFIRSLYPAADWRIDEINVRSLITSDATKRGRMHELVISNWQGKGLF